MQRLSRFAIVTAAIFAPAVLGDPLPIKDKAQEAVDTTVKQAADAVDQVKQAAAQAGDAVQQSFSVTLDGDGCYVVKSVDLKLSLCEDENSAKHPQYFDGKS